MINKAIQARLGKKTVNFLRRYGKTPGPQIKEDSATLKGFLTLGQKSMAGVFTESEREFLALLISHTTYPEHNTTELCYLFYQEIENRLDVNGEKIPDPVEPAEFMEKIKTLNVLQVYAIWHLARK